MPTTILALPSKSTLRLSPSDRALGRLVTLGLTREPDGTAQSDLAGDAFYALFKADPQAREDVPPERRINQAVLEWARSTQGWEASRASTVANLPAAAAAAGLLWELLTSEPALQEALKRQEEADQAAVQARVLEATAQGLQAAGLDGEAGKAAAQAQALRQAAGQAAEEAIAAVQGAQDDPMARAGVAKAVRDAEREAREAAAVVAGGGGSGE